MGYIVEYKEEEYNEVIEKVKQAKKLICEAMDMLEENSLEERGSYRGGSYRSGGGYREGSYRDEEYDEGMNMRRSRNSRGRYM